MTRESRRRFLKQLGLAGVASTTVGSGTALADNHEGQSNGEENRRTRGRIDPLGHELQEGSPVYTFGDVNEDGTWGVISSWVGFGSTTTSTLYDLSDPETPKKSIASVQRSVRTRTTFASTGPATASTTGRWSVATWTVSR